MRSVTFEEALEYWIAFGFTLNIYLREPDKIPPEVKSFIFKIVRKLDMLVESSTIGKDAWLAISEYQTDSNPKLFRAVWGSFAKKIITHVSKNPGKEFYLQADPGFESWTADIDIALNKFTNEQTKYNVIFQSECYVGEQALVIGGYAYEILFPRDKCWVIVKCEKLERRGRTIILLTVKEHIWN